MADKYFSLFDGKQNGVNSSKNPLQAGKMSITTDCGNIYYDIEDNSSTKRILLGAGYKTADHGVIFNLYKDTTFTESIETTLGTFDIDQVIPKNKAGAYGSAEGVGTSAIGKGSKASGVKTEAYGEGSAALGVGVTAIGAASYAEGRGNKFDVEVKHIQSGNKMITVTIADSAVPQITNDVLGAKKNAMKVALAQSIKKNAVVWFESDTSAHTGEFYVVTKIEHVNTVSAECRFTLDRAVNFTTDNILTIFMGAAISPISHVEGNYCNTLDLSATSLEIITDKESNNQRQHAEGSRTLALGYAAHSEGELTVAEGNMSHAQGKNTTAKGGSSFAGGDSTLASGYSSTALGYGTTASNENAVALGYNTIASGKQSVAEGHGTQATNANTHAEGYNTIAEGEASHAEGNGGVAGGYASHVEGNTTHAEGNYSHAEGNNTYALGAATHAEGNNTTASNSYSHAEGVRSKAAEYASHAEGYETQALSKNSHVEGVRSKTQGVASHAQGSECITYGLATHAEGIGTKAGNESYASSENHSDPGSGAHSEGLWTKATGRASHAGGISTRATAEAQTAIGIYNKEDSDALFIVGNGIGDGDRSNAISVKKTGKILGGSQTSDDDDVLTLITKGYLESKIKSGGSIAVDQIYNPESENAQSGVALGTEFQKYFKIWKPNTEYNIGDRVIASLLDDNIGIPTLAFCQCLIAHNSGGLSFINETSDFEKYWSYEKPSIYSSVHTKYDEYGHDIYQTYATKEEVGDIETALDSIIAIQNEILGGDSV